MARIRTIKPEFWDSPGTAKAGLRARLFFIAMWNWADDYGIGTANPRHLVSFAFPNDPDVSEADFPRLRAEVAECFDVTFYEVDGRPYYAIPSWDKHQKNERRAAQRNPGPDKGIRVECGTSAQTHGSSALGTGEQGNRGTGEDTRSADADHEFEAWWKLYPRKIGKGQARKAYASAAKKATSDELSSAASRFAAQVSASQTEERFIPHPATWLNGERWTDATPAPNGGARQNVVTDASGTQYEVIW